MKRKFLTLLFMLVISACTFGGCTFSIFPKPVPTNTFTTPITVAPNSTATEIVEASIDAVVTIFITNRRTGEEVSFGSGVAVASGGYIATNYHVISTAASTANYKIEVYHNKSETAHNASLLWYNVNLDCAIIKCECINLPYVQMADRFIETESKLKPLEQVIAIGTPVDFSLQNTSTLGYVSSTQGRISYSDGVVYENLIQHTAPINHGNSGGPLFDMTGKLIGLNTLGNDEANSLFFAVPIYPVMLVIDKVVAGDQTSNKWQTPVVGISAVDRYQSEYSSYYFEGKGMKVTDITENSASVGKFKVDDIIEAVKIGDTTYTIDIRNDMLIPLLKANKGDTVTFTIIRGIVRQTIDITLG